ncbi:Killer cell lectin-like receptor subfamily F member 1, partial [Varanus komodoensis]
MDEGRFVIDRPGIKQQHRQAQGVTDETPWHPLAGSKTRNTSKTLTMCKISLGIIGTACVILGVTVIVLVIFVLQGRFQKCETTRTVNATVNQTESLASLKRIEDSLCSKRIAVHLCDPFEEGATCKLCPTNWAEQKGKCYWFSKDKKNWMLSYRDCSRKVAQMLVFQDREEMEFIHSILQEKYPVWIGVNITSPRKTWTWVDGSALNQTLISLPLPGNAASCGIIKGDKVRSEMCTAEF